MSEKKQANRRVLAEYTYEAQLVERGYVGQTLYVNVSDNTIAAKPVTDLMKEKFIGGRGFGLWLLSPSRP
jgi:aldehyde:ferredoxin oxidoreductase